jgi:hypothetical protein
MTKNTASAVYTGGQYYKQFVIVNMTPLESLVSDAPNCGVTQCL